MADKIDYILVQANFRAWNEALLSRDAKKVAALYADDATFLPTVSPEFKKDKAGAEQYFVHFLEKNPKGAVIEQEMQILAPTIYLHSGMYNFEVGPADKRETVEARFTFVWQKNEKAEWQIIHHHSSMKPKV